MGLFTLFTSSFLKVGYLYCMYCIWKYYHYYHTVLGWCKVKQRQIYLFKNKNTLPDVGHIHAPIHHISLSCHWSSSQLHTECPTLGALRRKESCLLSSSCHLCLCPQRLTSWHQSLVSSLLLKLQMTLHSSRECEVREQVWCTCISSGGREWGSAETERWRLVVVRTKNISNLHKLEHCSYA